MLNEVVLLNTDILKRQDLFLYYHDKMPYERQKKIDAFRFEKDQRLSLGAGILLMDLTVRQGCPNAPVISGKYGKPYIKGLENCHFNLSHSGSVAACAISDRPVGVDIEQVRHFEEKLVSRIFSEEEIRLARDGGEDEHIIYTRLWTMKESVMKYLGKGLSMDPSDITLKDWKIRSWSLGDYQLSVCSDYEEFTAEPRWVTVGTVLSDKG